MIHSHLLTFFIVHQDDISLCYYIYIFKKNHIEIYYLTPYAVKLIHIKQDSKMKISTDIF